MTIRYVVILKNDYHVRLVNIHHLIKKFYVLVVRTL